MMMMMKNWGDFHKSSTSRQSLSKAFYPWIFVQLKAIMFVLIFLSFTHNIMIFTIIIIIVTIILITIIKMDLRFSARVR